MGKSNTSQKSLPVADGVRLQKMKATLCKNKHGYGNKYSLVPTLNISGEQWPQEGDQSGKP